MVRYGSTAPSTSNTRMPPTWRARDPVTVAPRQRIKILSHAVIFPEAVSRTTTMAG